MVSTLKASIRRRQNLRVDALSKQLASRLRPWFNKLREKELRRVLSDLRSGSLSFAKASMSASEKELLDLLMKFGLRQVTDASKRIQKDLTGVWVIDPSLEKKIIEEKKILVKNISRSVRNDVKEALRKLSLEVSLESPKPSVGELAKRITEMFDGGEKSLYAFSPERSALIARTESIQNENTGIFNGMKEADIEQIEWVSSNNSNHGDRRHDLMNGKKIDIDDYFVTPLGNRLRYPGDPEGPIKETANCGCVFVPVKEPRS